MTKRSMDLAISIALAPLVFPVLLLCYSVVFLSDGRSPRYSQLRVGQRGILIRVEKVRTMQIGSLGPSTTANDDPRILPAGKFLRRLKLDELPQIFNVICGSMSLVGPRPNVPVEVAKYTAEEMELLSVRPGITDISSIVLADLGGLVGESKHADAQYDAVIRPLKANLALIYIQQPWSFGLDLRILVCSVCAAVSPRLARRMTNWQLVKRGPLPDASKEVLAAALLRTN